MAFCVAACPKCEKRLRLLWRIGKRKPEPSQVIRLTCVHCDARFEQVAVKLVVFSAGAEDFSESVVVEPPCLVGRGK